ncbi:GAF domain-containing protein [uncultured Acetatifactor sp.]|uniref:GAF domain-containing protein n=1 Tax=uncultured Acetatifactor sp. TaxID=1671927 RepID=UPI002ED056FC
MTDYSLLREQLASMTRTERDTIANLANASALLYMSLSDINWAGFYLVREGQLVLGPFQGKPACIRIDFGKGVCGNAAAGDAAILIPDVHAFPGHIACDAASRSEIVVPVHHAGRLTAVLDIDSPLRGRFAREDQEGLERFCSVLEDACDWRI